LLDPGAEDLPRSAGTDWLRVPYLGAFLRYRHSRKILQLPPLVIAVAMIAHGFWGPQLAPRNLATLLTWVHFRGLLVLVLLGAGNLFCMACPFMLPRELARRLRAPTLRWPRALRSKWLAVGLLVLVLFAYELFGLWSSPWWTAWLILGYFLAALLVDGLFQKASFCKWVCPLGQFNFVASTLSPLEITTRDPSTCATCKTKDCIAGTRAAHAPHAIGRPGQPGNFGSPEFSGTSATSSPSGTSPSSGTSRIPAPRLAVIQRGCELELFQPRKVGNLDCTFCLDCVYACPHDNVALTTRVPASELWIDPRRSGIGHLSRRKDLAALVLVFTFGAMLNAFGMVSPVWVARAWIAARLGFHHDPQSPPDATAALFQGTATLGVLFLLLLVVEPFLLLGGAAWLARRLGGLRQPLIPLATRFAYALAPLGVGIWLAHYSFHFFTGLWTFVPVAQGALADAGLPLLGHPNWRLTGLSPQLIHPLELAFLALGLLGSLLVAWRIAQREAPQRALPVFLPWAALCLLLWASALWLLAQPMEMRGTFMAS
jgi:ferredoxin